MNYSESRNFQEIFESTKQVYCNEDDFPDTLIDLLIAYYRPVFHIMFFKLLVVMLRIVFVVYDELDHQLLDFELLYRQIKASFQSLVQCVHVFISIVWFQTASFINKHLNQFKILYHTCIPTYYAIFNLRLASCLIYFSNKCFR